MKDLNTSQMGTAAGVKATLPRPIDFPEGRGCARLRVEAAVPVKNITAGALDYTGARLKKAIACMFSQHTLRFGDRAADIVDNALPFDRARELALAMSGDDFIVIHPTTNVPTRLKDIADADVLKAGVGAGASFVLTLEWVRPFEDIRLGEDAYAYCPGATQMRQVQLEFVRGADFDTNGNFIQEAAADFTYLVDDFEAGDDKWAKVIRLYTQEEAGQISHGPKGPIGLIAMWLYNSAGAATALGRFSVTRDADVPLHDNARAKVVVRDALYTDPPGTYDLNGLATVLVQLPDGSERNDIPTGQGFRFVQPGSELNPAKSAWLYIPAWTEAEVDEYIGRNVEDADGVKLVNAAAKSGKGLGSGAASLEPVIIARRGSADFEALPGRVYARNVNPSTHIPAGVAAAAAAAAKSGGDAEGQAAASAKAATAVSKAVPGAASAVRGRKSLFWGTLRNRLRA